MFAVVIARPDVPLLGFGNLEFEKLKTMITTKDEIIDAVRQAIIADNVNLTGRARLYKGDVYILELIEKAIMRLEAQKPNEETVKAASECNCGFKKVKCDNSCMAFINFSSPPQ